MRQATCNGEEFACMQLNYLVLEFDDQAALDAKKAFVRVGMEVPRIRLGHCGDADHVIVHDSDGMIVVLRGRCRFCGKIDDGA